MKNEADTGVLCSAKIICVELLIKRNNIVFALQISIYILLEIEPEQRFGGRLQIVFPVSSIHFTSSVNLQQRPFPSSQSSEVKCDIE